MRFELDGVIRYPTSGFQLKILRPIVFDGEEGKVIGIVGENGAGKTTIVRAILGNPMVKLNGVLSFHNDGRMAKIAYCPQDVALRKVVNVADYLGTEGNAKSLAERLGIPLDLKSNEISAGTLRKMFILKTLLLDRDVYILDEPTNYIDRAAKKCLVDIIKEKMERGTWFFIAGNDAEFLCKIVTDFIYVYYRDKNEGGADYLELKPLVVMPFKPLHAVAYQYVTFFTKHLYRDGREVEKKIHAFGEQTIADVI